MSGVPELRDIAIISHVDYGKSTLVDAMLRQAAMAPSGCRAAIRPEGLWRERAAG